MKTMKTMTDKEKLKKLFTEFEIGFTEEDGSIVCETGGKNIGGYNGFITIFEFDEKDKFVEIGAWE